MSFTIGQALQELADSKKVFSPNGIAIWHLNNARCNQKAVSALRCDDGWISYTPRSTGVRVKGNRRRRCKIKKS